MARHLSTCISGVRMASYFRVLEGTQKAQAIASADVEISLLVPEVSRPELGRIPRAHLLCLFFAIPINLLSPLGRALVYSPLLKHSLRNCVRIWKHEFLWSLGEFLPFQTVPTTTRYKLPILRKKRRP